MAKARKRTLQPRELDDDPLPTEMAIQYPESGETPLDEMEVADELEPEDQPFVYDEEASNLVAAFKANREGKEFLRKFAQETINKFKEAFDSTENYRQRIAEDMKLFSGDLPPKTWPFEHAANAHVPIMLENITRVTTRLKAELFGDGNNVFSVVPVGPDDQDTADVLSLHGNWQFREQIRDFDRQMDRALLAYIMWGDFTTHSYYDEESRTNRHEVLTPDEFVLPYVFVTTQPDYSDVPYYFKILRRYRHELQAMKDKWEGVDEVISRASPTWWDEPESLLRDSVAETQHVEIPDTSGAPYKLIMYEGWEELPNQDRDRFVQAIIDTTTSNVLLLTFHEEIDWRDRKRHERQKQEKMAYKLGMAQHQRQVDELNEQDASMRDQLAAAGDVPAEMKSMMLGAAGSMVAYPSAPPKPSWMGEDDEAVEPAPLRKVPIRMFTHGVCIENMVGSLGLSYGRIQADYNRAANVSLSQFTDSATIGNCPMLIVTEGVTFPRPFKYTPGGIMTFGGVSGSELSQNIYALKGEPANPQLVQLVDKFYQYGQSSMQAPSVLSGEAGKSGETAKGLTARIDQATKQMSVVARKFARGPLKQILLNNAKLNSIFLDDEEMVSVVDYKLGSLVNIKVGRDLYRRDYNVTISADLRFASESQKVAEADELVQMPQAVPALQQNIPFIYATIKKALEARNRYDMANLLGPPPPPPTTPLGMPPPAPPPPPGAPPGAGGPPGGGGAPPGAGGPPPGPGA